jgi:tetratricopeptide (TPR) repeat protein/DNA-binding CsgD family transcriptional regulator
MNYSNLRYIIVLFSIFVTSKPLFANLDSLRIALTTAIDDSTRFNINIQLTNYYFKRDVDSALFFANNAVQLANELDESVYYTLSKNELASIFFQQGNYGRAMAYYYDVLKIHEEEKDSIQLLVSYFNIALVYDKLNDNRKSQDYYFKSLEILESFLKTDPEKVLIFAIGRIYNNLGITFHNDKQYDKALDYYHKAIQISEETNNKAALPYAYNNIGLVYKELGDYDIALTFYDKSLSIREQIDDKEGIALTYSYFADCYNLKKDIQKAILYYNNALDLAKEVKNTNLQRVVAESLIKAYAQAENYKKSYEMHLVYKTLSDSLNLQEGSRTAAMLDMQYKFDKIQKEMELEQQQRIFRNLTVSGILFTLLVVTTLLFFLAQSKVRRIRLQRENYRLERDKLEDELDYKNKELTTNVMYLLRKNELINSMSEKLLALKNTLLKANQNAIQDIINELQRSIDDDVWKEFEYRFKDVHEGFYKKLNELFPDLTQNEKKLCAFLRLNMSTKEISAITFQSTHSITIARSRLRKKLNLTNQDVNLVEFLSNIE